MSETNLFKKYDVPAPRYTSYPTVPYWSQRPTSEQWIEALNEGLRPVDSKWALYIHIPFCESLCTYCGCNTVITKDHLVESPYLEAIKKEWQMYLQAVPDLHERGLSQIHLGGGTPTFFSAEHLKDLVSTLLAKTNTKFFEGSLEVDPRKTTEEQLQVLHQLGFSRISLGVQDFDPEVQRLVNRQQPYDITQKITQVSRQLGYTSVNFDLIYGLPKQNLTSFADTINKTIDLAPDRIALYSFALVPWIKRVHRIFRDEDLPQGEEKRALYEMSREKLLQADYIEIGMDHFALPHDSLTLAAKNKRLHRNFMGYADERTDVLLGLGVSAISETPTCFHQNEKVLNIYERRINNNEIPTLRGHLLTIEDQQLREQILCLMTQDQVELVSSKQKDWILERAQPLLSDGLIDFQGLTLRLTEKGKPFLRNVAMLFDARLLAEKPETKMFSQAL